MSLFYLTQQFVFKESMELLYGEFPEQLYVFVNNQGVFLFS